MIGHPEPMQAGPKIRRPSMASLVAISSLNPLAMNIVAPSLPGLALVFAVDYGVAQLTLTVYLASIAVAQLILGPLSDTYGRRPLVLLGIVVFILGSLVCAAAPNITTLLVGRVIQAFGGCAGFVLSRAMVRDLYDREQSASMIGIMTMVMVIAPMLSPLIGGAIDTAVGWRAVHLMLAAVAAVLLVYAFIALHETLHVRQKSSATPAELMASFRTLMTYPAFRGHALSISFTSATYFAFIAGAPYAVVTLMRLDPHVYGIWFAIAASGYMLGNFVTGRYGPRLGSRRLIRIGTIGALGGGITLAVSVALLPLTPETLFLPMVPITFFNGLTLPGATAGAISVRPDLAGASAGLSGSMQLGMGALASWAVGILVVHSLWLMIGLILLCGVGAVIGAALAERAEQAA
jgi:DHA1 family bicyclomycin/chloramphenicol resistance-like MFS transporter